MLFKPAFHKRTVAVALKSQRRQHLATAPRSGHRDAAGAMRLVRCGWCDAAGAMPQAFALTATSLAAPAVSPTQGVFDSGFIDSGFIDSGFIDIHPILRGDVAQLLQELFASCVIALDVEKTLFLRV